MQRCPVWSTEAAETAKKSSERCKFEHVDREQRKISECYCGENLYRNTASPNWTLAITAFCDEQKFFTYAGEKKDPKEETGHYTQTVWYLSAKVGCHCTYCGGTWMYACHQCPAGNVAPVNIPYESGSSCGQCPNNCRNKLCTNPCTKYNIVTKGNCETYKKRNLCNMDAMKQQCAASCNCEKEIY
ncbi:cysteine-rich venom protein kaouthin-2-like [Eleutherodactylus coqui]|uniref:cysteine-rich venom protein kaouthin-2-like n=1 Tax=Eleutherodactylus coqui TaxID=57060 RepID=UPI0034628B40